MKILAVADIHCYSTGFNINVKECSIDLIVSLGDVPHDIIELILLKKKNVPYFGVHGNHDIPKTVLKDDSQYEQKEALEDIIPKLYNVHLEVRELTGLTIGGFEGSWKYKPHNGRYQYTDEQVRKKLKNFSYVDIFIAHNPVAGIHDSNDNVHNGFSAFKEYIERTNPKLFLHGHVQKNQESYLGKTRIVSVCGKRVIEI